MRAVIIGNGSVSDYEHIKAFIQHDDYILCADGGLRHARAMDLEPELVIGDFDSADLSQCDYERILYPKRKDFTDGELCVQYANEHGFDEILLIGMSGSRADHTLTNILLLSQCRSGCMINDTNELYYMRTHLSFYDKKGKTLSIIPIRGDLCGISTKGLEYPLCNETLYFGESRGNSNVIIADKCEITAESGEGIVIINNGE